MVEGNNYSDDREARWTTRLEEVAAEGYDAVVGNSIKESLEKLLADEFFQTRFTRRLIDELSQSVYFASKVLNLPGPMFTLGSGETHNGWRYLAKTDVVGDVPVFTLSTQYVAGFLINPVTYSGDRVSPTALGAHEMFHADQYLSDRDQFDVVSQLTDEEWDNHPLDRAAQAFGRFFYNARAKGKKEYLGISLPQSSEEYVAIGNEIFRQVQGANPFALTGTEIKIKGK